MLWSSMQRSAWILNIKYSPSEEFCSWGRLHRFTPGPFSFLVPSHNGLFPVRGHGGNSREKLEAAPHGKWTLTSQCEEYRLDLWVSAPGFILRLTTVSENFWLALRSLFQQYVCKWTFRLALIYKFPGVCVSCPDVSINYCRKNSSIIHQPDYLQVPFQAGEAVGGGEDGVGVDQEVLPLTHGVNLVKFNSFGLGFLYLWARG